MSLCYGQRIGKVHRWACGLNTEIGCSHFIWRKWRKMGGKSKANINGHWIFRIYWGKESTIRKTKRQMQLKTLFFLVSKRPICIGQVFPLFLLPLSRSSSFLCVDLWMFKLFCLDILLLSISIPQEFTTFITLKITCMSKIQIYFSNPVISSSRLVTATPWDHLCLDAPYATYVSFLQIKL